MLGYLQAPYTSYSYLTVRETRSVGFQAERIIQKTGSRHLETQKVITGTPHAVKSELGRTIHTTKKAGFEADRLVATSKRIKQDVIKQIGSPGHRLKGETSRLIHHTQRLKMDLLRTLIDQSHRVKAETLRAIIAASHNLKQETSRVITGQSRSLKAEVRRGNLASTNRHFDLVRRLDKTKALATQIKEGKLVHLGPFTYDTGSYLSQGYLNDGNMAALLPMEVDRNLVHTHSLSLETLRVLTKTKSVHFEVLKKFSVPHPVRFDVHRYFVVTQLVKGETQRVIHTSHRLKNETERVLSKSHLVHFDITRTRSRRVFFALTRVMYNATNLRVLMDFDSRGTSDGLNWTTTSQASGDFSVNNLNSDILEQVYRSVSGQKSITLTCDTQVSQGVFVDTLAILGHNLTKSALITWQSSNSSSFATVGQSVSIPCTTQHTYWVASTLPLESYRYQRFVISDVTNTNAYLEVGGIVFGSAVIMQNENIVDQISKQTIHYTDSIQTEAFTHVMNDRALKTQIGLQFQNIELSRGNYDRLRTIFETARTNLKCLWIPTPAYPTRYGIFGKMAQIPQESHNDMGLGQDYVSFDVQIDEAL